MAIHSHSKKSIDTKCGVMYNNIERGSEKQISKFDKLLREILSLSKGLRFAELRKVLEFYGYTMETPRSGSSHYTFRKSGYNPITIPKHEPIKKVYVQKVKEIVEAEYYDKK